MIDDEGFARMAADGIRKIVAQFSGSGGAGGASWIAFFYADGDRDRQEEILAELADDGGDPWFGDPRDEANRKKYREDIENILCGEFGRFEAKEYTCGLLTVSVDDRRVSVSGGRFAWIRFDRVLTARSDRGVESCT